MAANPRNDDGLHRNPRPNRLFVEPSTTDDNSIVNLSQAKVDELKMGVGDYLLLRGRRRRETVCVLVPDDKLDSDDGIRLNKYARGNLRVKVGDVVSVRVYRGILYATRLHVVPVQESMNGVACSNLVDVYLRPYFGDGHRPVTKGDVFLVRGGMTSVEFKTEECWMNDVGYEDVGGCGKSLSMVREIVELPLRHPQIFESVANEPSRGVLLCGAPGTGKTLIARAVANETGAYFLLINGPEIMNKMIGEAEADLRKAFEAAAQNAPSIIFIDDLDAIAPKRDKCHGELDKRVVAQLLTLMDGMKQRSKVIVMAATNRPNSIDQSLRRFGRFDFEVDIGIPDPQGRLEILKIHTRNMSLATGVDLNQISTETSGFVGVNIKALCYLAIHLQIRETFADFDIDEDTLDPALFASLAISQDNLMVALHQIKHEVSNTSALLLASVPNITLDSIGGLKDTKRELQEAIEFPIKRRDLYKNLGIAAPKGALLFGPPGCGKTLLGKAVAGHCQVNFLSIDCPQLISPEFGRTEANIRSVFQKARSASPCIVFLDEVDTISRARGTTIENSTNSDNLTNLLLVELNVVDNMDGVFVIGATNRPGRLSQLVFIPPPDEESRLLILQSILGKTALEKDVDLKLFARRTHLFSSADLRGLCEGACKEAVSERIKEEEKGDVDTPLSLTNKHFERAFKLTRRSITDAELRKFAEFATSKQAGSSAMDCDYLT